MRLSITLILILNLAGCCLNFTDMTPADVYQVGDTITTSGTNIVVEKFQWSNDIWTSSGTVKVDTSNHARGSGIDINSRNANLHFQFNYPLNEITFKFGELGGNINITVNDDFRNIQDIVSLNGTMIGGVQVTITSYQQGNNWYGEMILTGTINDFIIGGQELWLYYICH